MYISLIIIGKLNMLYWKNVSELAAHASEQSPFETFSKTSWWWEWRVVLNIDVCKLNTKQLFFLLVPGIYGIPEGLRNAKWRLCAKTVDEQSCMFEFAACCFYLLYLTLRPFFIGRNHYRRNSWCLWIRHHEWYDKNVLSRSIYCDLRDRQ